MNHCYIDSPVGRFLIAGTKDALHFTSFSSGVSPKLPEPHWHQCDTALAPAVAQFNAYFDGSLTEFDLPHSPSGTEFQLKVWEALKTVPYGRTESYGHIAALVGSPGASQAVGSANGANPLPILIPCHRIIGSDGSLTGFGGGLPTKHTLLRLEGIACAEDQLDLFV